MAPAHRLPVRLAIPAGYLCGVPLPSKSKVCKRSDWAATRWLRVGDEISSVNLQCDRSGLRWMWKLGGGGILGRRMVWRDVKPAPPSFNQDTLALEHDSVSLAQQDGNVHEPTNQPDSQLSRDMDVAMASIHQGGKLIELCAEKYESFDARNMCKAMKMLQSLCFSRTQPAEQKDAAMSVMRLILPRASTMVSVMYGPCLVVLLWTYQQCRTKPDEQLIDNVTRQALLKIDRPSTACMLLAAYVSLRQHPGLALLKSVQELCVSKDRFTGKHISGILWAFAKFHYDPGQEILDQLLSQRVVPTFDKLPFNETINLAWALTQFRWTTPPNNNLLLAWDARILEFLESTDSHITSHNLPLILWVYAKLARTPCEKFLVATKKHIQEKGHAMSGNGLSNTMWALGKLKVPVEDDLYAMLCGVAVQKV